MKLTDSNLSLVGSSFGKYLPRMAFLTLFALFFAGGAQAQGGGCNNISYTFEQYEPCKFRARYQNTSECYIEIRYALASGEFASWSVNSAAGFTVEVISPSELWVHHNGGFMPLGNQVPLLFTLPHDLVTTIGVAWLDECQQVGCELFPGPTLESCPDPQDASIIGVKYRECAGLPYGGPQPQPLIGDWTIQLLNADGFVIGEQVTDAGGAYAFYDLPKGLYYIKEAVKPGWTANVPANGQYTVDLAASQQAVRNFGNCPSCSCDNIYMDVVQLPISSDTCSYILNVSNNDDYCFNEIDLKVAVGSFASVTPATGWTATMVSAQHYKLTFPPNYIPAQSFQSTFFKVTGAAQHNITVSTSWNNNGVLVTCSRPFSYQCPPPVSPQPCCPTGSTFGPELVCNPDFGLGNQCFTNDYNYFAPGGTTAIGSYSVLNYGQVYTANNQWACIDHTTYTTAGPMLTVDGYGGPIAWEQQVSVTAGTTYAFSAWFNNLVKPTLNYDDPQMALWVGGSQIAASPILTENPDRWEWLCAQYTATQTGLVTLQIRMLANTSIGNDVGIDDVSFRVCIPPPPCSVSISASPTPFCGTGTLTANATGAGPFSYQWSHGQNTQSINVQGLPCGTVCSVSVTCADGTMSSASYTVSDVVPPVAVCNLGIGVDLGTACTFQVTPAFVDGGSTDNCAILSMSVSPAVLQACTNTIVTLTVTDWCGNTSTCTMGIQTIEAVPPVINCPANVSVSGTINPQGLCKAVVTGIAPSASDNCSTPSVSYLISAPTGGGGNTDASGTNFMQGLSTVTYTATDGCGNTASCSFTVNVTCDSCCTNYDQFCQAVMNATTITVDNALCKATLNIGNLPCTSYIDKIDWGQGPLDNNNYGAGDMPMHTYTGSGIYTICYLAIELDNNGLICFEKWICDTIPIDCTLCPCTDFDDQSIGDWTVQLGTVSIDAPGPSGLPSDYFLHAFDGQGASWITNQMDYDGDWNDYIGKCFCWDFQVIDDGDPGTLNINPWFRIFWGPPNNPIMSAQFTASTPFNENSGWGRVCAPIDLCDNSGNLPSNLQGSWQWINGGSTCADWQTLLNNVDGIRFFLDRTSSPTEEYGFDNICIKSCDECACESNLTLTHGSNTLYAFCDPHTGFIPAFLCPVEDVTVSGLFGCRNTLTGALCQPTDVWWQLDRPGNLSDPSGLTTNFPSLTFPAADVSQPGTYCLWLRTVCPGSTDTCVCKVTWVQEPCDSCVCAPGGSISPSLVLNGNFGYGDSYFSSFLTQGPQQSCTAASYWVDDNFTDKCTGWPNFAGLPDGTLGTNNFLMVDGEPVSPNPTTVWSESANVIPGMSYCFSIATASVYAQQNFFLSVIVQDANGNQVGAPVAAPSVSGSPAWANQSFTWNCPSGAIGPFTLSIIQPTSGAFRDFGIDNICFTKQDTCCTTLEDFCDRVENAVNISVDNMLCKATLNIGNFIGCDDYIAWVQWDNSLPPVFGPFVSGDMPMHTYPGSGTYEICYLAIERDANGQICFEKVICDTISLVCTNCPCTDFDDQSIGVWSAQFGNIAIDSPGPSQLPNDYFMHATDDEGASWITNFTDYGGDWNDYIGKCFCWDFQVINDGSPGTLNINPWFRIFLGNPNSPIMSAQFTASPPVTENSGWSHICAPIELCDNSGNLPSNAQGSWQWINGGSTCADWQTLLSNVSGIRFFLDRTSSPTEEYGFDNICIEPCSNCECLGFEDLNFISPNGDFLFVECGDLTPVDLPCPDTVPGDFVFHGNLLCSDWHCGSTVDWEISPLGNQPIFSGTASLYPSGGGSNHFDLPTFSYGNFPGPGTYQLSLTGHCDLDECECVLFFTVPDCGCECLGADNLSFIAGDSTSTGNLPVACGNTTPVPLPCPVSPDQTFIYHGDVHCSGFGCMASNFTWRYDELVFPFNSFTGAPTALSWTDTKDGHFDLTLPYSLFTPDVPYELTITHYCGGMPCHCKVRFIIDCDSSSCDFAPCPGSSIWQNVTNNYFIQDMVVYQGQLIAAGSFNFGGANNIAAWNGTSWSPLGAGTNGTIEALAVHNGLLYVGGGFSTPGNNIAAWNGTTWSTLGTGTDGPVFGLESYNSELVVGGAFSLADVLSVGNIARWNGTSWSSLGLALNGPVRGLGLYNSNLVVGGVFSTAGGNAANNIAQWNGTNWGSLGGGINLISGNVFQAVKAMLQLGPDLIVGGRFMDASNVPGTKFIARWDGTNWNSMATGVNTSFEGIYDLKLYGGELYAGGLFTQIGGSNISGVAHWNGTNWLTTGHANQLVRALVCYMEPGSSCDLYSGGEVFLNNWACVTSTSEAVRHNMRIFPNPNPGTFSVELSEPAKPEMTFRIVGLTGQRLLELPTQAGSAMQTVQTGDLPAGLYFLQVVSDGKVLAVEKFVKQ